MKKAAEQARRGLDTETGKQGGSSISNGGARYSGASARGSAAPAAKKRKTQVEIKDTKRKQTPKACHTTSVGASGGGGRGSRIMKPLSDSLQNLGTTTTGTASTTTARKRPRQNSAGTTRKLPRQAQTSPVLSASNGSSVKPRAAKPKRQFEVSQSVVVRCSGAWWDATLVQRHTDGSWLVRYGNQETESAVSPGRVSHLRG